VQGSVLDDAQELLVATAVAAGCAHLGSRRRTVPPRPKQSVPGISRTAARHLKDVRHGNRRSGLLSATHPVDTWISEVVLQGVEERCVSRQCTASSGWFYYRWGFFPADPGLIRSKRGRSHPRFCRIDARPRNDGSRMEVGFRGGEIKLPAAS
jgi:hypothetical protein